MITFNLTGYYTLMNDEVNRPDHYNKGGIQVIDVIETYAKTDFRLANVLKYVCRCEYKGRKLQDLEKAAWYLNRVIEDEKARIGCEEWEAGRVVPVVKSTKPEGFPPCSGPSGKGPKWDDHNGTWPRPEDEEGEQPEVTLKEALEAASREVAESPDWLKSIYERNDALIATALRREVEVFFEGYDCRKQEEAEIEAALKDESWSLRPMCKHLRLPEDCADCRSFEVTLPPDRIAGDDAAAQRIKDEYYAFNRFEIRGYCASCDAEIGATQPFFRDPNQFDAGLMFCKPQCITSLREWQKVEL